MSASNDKVVTNGKHAYFQDVEVVVGDPKYDGRVILYVIKGTQTSLGPTNIITKSFQV